MSRGQNVSQRGSHDSQSFHDHSVVGTGHHRHLPDHRNQQKRVTRCLGEGVCFPGQRGCFGTEAGVGPPPPRPTVTPVACWPCLSLSPQERTMFHHHGHPSRPLPPNTVDYCRLHPCWYHRPQDWRPVVWCRREEGRPVHAWLQQVQARTHEQLASSHKCPVLPSLSCDQQWGPPEVQQLDPGSQRERCRCFVAPVLASTKSAR